MTFRIGDSYNFSVYLKEVLKCLTNKSHEIEPGDGRADRQRTVHDTVPFYPLDTEP